MTSFVPPHDLVYEMTEHKEFGRPLGINLLGSRKICSFDCRYCNLGPSSLTMNQIRKKTEFADVETVLSAIRTAITNPPYQIDSLILSGNGEPTLYPDFDKLMAELNHLRTELLPKAKIVVFTNGAHLDNKKVVAGLNLADERVLKVDVGNDDALKAVNRPLVRLTVNKLYSGARALTNCIVQSLFIEGEHAKHSEQDLEEWMEVVGIIRPKKVLLSTILDPPSDSSSEPVDEDFLYKLAFQLKKRTQLETAVL